MSKLKSNPLVSVIVIAYNSENYILETLESIKDQTYQNIELVISDDCSIDNTIKICQQWLNENKERFVEAHLVTSPVNTGIPANINRALERCKGVWIKGIAADDVLLPSCIDLFKSFIDKEPNARVVHSSIDYYQDDFSNANFIRRRDLSSHPITYKSTSSRKQFKILLKENVINAPGSIISFSLLNEMGRYDETYAIEDWPMWLTITKYNNKIYYLNKSTVKYRIHSQSITQRKNSEKLYGSMYEKLRSVYKKLILPELPILDKLKINYVYFVYLTFDRIGLNRNLFFNKILLNLLIGNIGIFKTKIKDTIVIWAKK